MKSFASEPHQADRVIRNVALVDWGDLDAVIRRAILLPGRRVVTYSHDVPSEYLRTGGIVRIYTIDGLRPILGDGRPTLTRLLVPSGRDRVRGIPSLAGRVICYSEPANLDFVLIEMSVGTDLEPLSLSETVPSELYVAMLGERFGSFVRGWLLSESEKITSCTHPRLEIRLEREAWHGWSGAAVVSEQCWLTGMVVEMALHHNDHVCICHSSAWECQET